WTMAAAQIDLERKKREAERERYIKKHGVDYRVNANGRAKLPRKRKDALLLLHTLRERVENDRLVERDVGVRLPDKLSEDNDPPTRDLLPLAGDRLTAQEKVVV